MDFDEPNNNRWTLFANVRLNNAKGEYLGVTGFGRDLCVYERYFSKARNLHKLKVYFIDDKGNMVLGSLADNIKDRLLSKEKRKDGEYFKFDEEEDKFIAARYMEQMDASGRKKEGSL